MTEPSTQLFIGNQPVVRSRIAPTCETLPERKPSRSPFPSSGVGATGLDWRRPIDGLASPVARLLFDRRLRQGLVQAVRRSPIKSQATSSRIDPRRMVAATGLAATAASRLGAETFWAELRDRLGGWTATRPAIEGDFRGLWGYEFDVQTRWGYYRVGSPNAIATVIAGHGCLDAGSLHRERRRLLSGPLSFSTSGGARTRPTRLTATSSSIMQTCSSPPLQPDWRPTVRSRGRSRTRCAEQPHPRWKRPWPGSVPMARGRTAKAPRSLGRRLPHRLSLLALDDATMLLGGTDSRAALEQGARYYFDRLFDGAVPRFLAGRKAGPSDVNNVATGLRAAVWGSSRGYTAPDFPTQVFEVLRKDFWCPARRYVRASANRLRPTAWLDYPRWGAAPALDALTALRLQMRKGDGSDSYRSR